MSKDDDNIKFFPGVDKSTLGSNKSTRFNSGTDHVSVKELVDYISESADDYKTIVFILKAKDGIISVGANTGYDVALALLNRSTAELSDIVLEQDGE